ncbi:uncharacterized protein [Narcine bancroftii]|uniref:uncharacterized protein isoform X3 n=1 Tax=Narcine bancroftii TaxID=1343680 RepID=UPI003831B1F1
MAQYEDIQLENKDNDTMKNYIQSSHGILVSALYNINPLLDQMIATHLLTFENYCEIRTEKIPPQKARKLLEIVQLQMNESDAWKFIECLKKCKHHYPCLKNWLAVDFKGFKRGLTEHKLQQQASVLCQRLGHLITPIAMKLFSNETISQYELDIVQGETTLYCQAQKLINICLQKGERSCQRLYEALQEEDTVLAEDIDDAEQPASLSFHNPFSQEETQAVFSCVQLSRRAKLLLELLQSGLADCHCCEEVTQQLSNICLFIVRDCLAETEENASEVPTLDIMECLRRLERNRHADMMILRELAELWSEGAVENFQKSVPFIAQLVKDSFPHLDAMEFDAVPIRKGVYRCHPRAVKRVTSFKGLPARIIQKMIQPKSLLSLLSKERGSFGNQEMVDGEYTQLCLKTLNILQKVQDNQLDHLPTKRSRQLNKHEVAMEIRELLAAEYFRWSSFDSGMRARLLSLVDFEPLSCNMNLLLKLHYDTFLSLAEYLKSNDSQHFQVVFEEVHMSQCNAELHGVRSVRDPVTIDGGMEEVYRFSTSSRASFLVQLHCRGYIDSKYFQCKRPLLYKLPNLSDSLLEKVEKVGTVIAKQAGTTWIREDPDGGLKEITERMNQTTNGSVEIGSCCFLINSWSAECEIRVLYKDDTIIVTAERNADVY